MVARPTVVVVLLGVLSLGGCSDGKEGVPVACRQGAETVRAALRSAPRPVTLDGTPLSGCIKDTSGGGTLQEVGEAYLTVASELADRAARNRDGVAALRLGYLLGAYERSRTGAQGVGYELGRRLRTEVGRVGVRSAAFRRGEQAGRRHG